MSARRGHTAKFRIARNDRMLPCGHSIRRKQKVRRVFENHSASAATAPIMCPTCKTRQDVPSMWLQ